MKSRGRVAVAVIALFGLSVLLGACSGSLSGVVVGKANQKPVPGATVKAGPKSAITDSAGRYAVDGLPTGATTVSVGATGYGLATSQVNVKRGQNALDVALIDGQVAGSLTENAVEVLPIVKARVTIAGKAATVSGGHFSAADVPVGPQVVTVSAPGHEAFAEKVTIAAGANAVPVKLNLTPAATYMRYYEAYRFDHWRLAYLYLHPDVRRHYSYQKFVKSMAGEVTLSLKLFATKKLRTWHPSFAHKTYHNVVAIDRAYIYQDAYGTATDNATQHFQQIDGRWYIIWDWTS
jgi:hypothetical protein